MRYKIDEIVQLIMDYRGKTPKKLGMNWTENQKDIIALSAKNIKDNKIVNTDKSHYGSELLYKHWMKDGDIEPGDILMTSEAPLGEVYLVSKPIKAILSQRLFLLRFNKNIVNPWYMYAFMNSQSFKNQLLLRATGTTVVGIKQKDLRKIEVELPSRELQNKIGSIFQFLYKKIHINGRINDNLLELVDTLFDNIIKCSILYKATLNDIGTIAGGGTPSKKVNVYWNGKIPWLTPKDLSKSHSIFTSKGTRFITEYGLKESSARLFPTGTVLFSSRAPIGYISIAKNNISTSQGFKSIIPNKGYSPEFIYELLKKETPLIIREANGSTFKEISGTRLKAHIVNIPSKAKAKYFDNSALAIFKLISKNENENKILKNLKKELLNKIF